MIWVISILVTQLHPQGLQISTVAGRSLLTAAATRAMGQLKSSRQVERKSMGRTGDGEIQRLWGVLNWLVVWNYGILWLSIYWECHHPNWRTHIFQRGGEKPPTSKMVVPQNSWLIIEKPRIKWMIWGYSYFRTPPYLQVQLWPTYSYKWLKMGWHNS